MINHMTIPERIVGEDETTGTENGKHHLIAFAVGALVAIYEGHVELDTELRCLNEGITDDELDLISHRRAFNPGTSKILHLVVDLKGVESSAFIEALSHGDGTITAERTDLKDRSRTYHSNEHLQQTALQMSAGHPAMDGVDVRGAPETIKVVGFRLRVAQDVIFYF